MHLVSDFDDTLVDTTRYWNVWLDKLERVGIDRELAIKKGTELFPITFSLIAHMESLSIPLATATELLKEMMEHVKEQGSAYVFSDVFDFFSRHKQEHSFSLLTYGDSENQMWRLKESGLEEIFSFIQIAGPDKHKVKHVSEMLQTVTQQIVFVDDSPNELNPVVDAGLPVVLYRLVRPGAKHDYVHDRDNLAWKRITSLSEIELN